MSKHQLMQTGVNMAIGTIAAVVLLSLLAFSQRKDAADEAAAVAHVQSQAHGEVNQAGK